MHMISWSGIVDLTPLRANFIADLRPIWAGFSGPTYGGASGGLRDESRENLRRRGGKRANRQRRYKL